MSESFLASKRIRKDFSKIRKIVEIPNLISMQTESFKRFMQMDVPPEKRKDIGLQSVFKSVFPIKDFTGSASLEFVSYRLCDIKHSIEECVHRGMSYEMPIRITVRLVVYDVDKEAQISNIRDIKEQEIYFGTIPLMTERGTFIVNGTERIVVSQLHRSSGVFFDHDKGKTHASGKIIYTSRIIPVRGSWIDMEIDHKGIVYVRIDRRRKFPITMLFKAFGYSSEDILAYFYKTEKIILHGKSYFKQFKSASRFVHDSLKGQHASKDIKCPKTGEIVVKKGRIITQRLIKRMESLNIESIPIDVEYILGRIFVSTIHDPNTGSPIVKCNETVDDDALKKLKNAGINQFDLLSIDGVRNSDSICRTLSLDMVEKREEALVEIYRRLRPGNPPVPEVAQDFLDNLFFKATYYDLSGVGRLKINLRLGINTSIDLRILRKEDILLTAKTLIDLRDTKGAVDDIDHLGNRHLKRVGELLNDQVKIALGRVN
ncbi:MAG: DNA-directed RNA polymerase subunit beta, partial [Desulfobacterales bacterium]|nr:DNA-directed RNA polymerase subunit beta [Desulfobacterales bacterium]